VSEVINNSKNEGQTGKREGNIRRRKKRRKRVTSYAGARFQYEEKHDRGLAACVLLFFSSTKNKTTPSPTKKKKIENIRKKILCICSIHETTLNGTEIENRKGSSSCRAA